jgi:hypothetical protein
MIKKDTFCRYTDENNQKCLEEAAEHLFDKPDQYIGGYCMEHLLLMIFDNYKEG